MFEKFNEALAVGDIQGVVSSTVGTIIIMVLSLLLLLLVLVFSGNKKSKSSGVKQLAYSGVAIAIATVLSEVKLPKLPQGGAVTFFSMLFIIVIGYFFGVRQGILAGIVYGLLQLAIAGTVMHPVQLLLDYPLAFGALGLSGLFSSSKHGLIKGVVIGALGRLLFHFLSGIIFFASYAPEGWNPFEYSLWYNFSYIGVEGAMTIAILLIPSVYGAIARVKKTAIA